MTDRIEMTRKAINDSIQVEYSFHKPKKYQLVNDPVLEKKLKTKLTKLLNEGKGKNVSAYDLIGCARTILNRDCSCNDGQDIGTNTIYINYRVPFKKETYLYCSTTIADICDSHYDTIEYFWIKENEEREDKKMTDYKYTLVSDFRVIERLDQLGKGAKRFSNYAYRDNDFASFDISEATAIIAPIDTATEYDDEYELKRRADIGILSEGEKFVRVSTQIKNTYKTNSEFVEIDYNWYLATPIAEEE